MLVGFADVRPEPRWNGARPARCSFSRFDQFTRGTVAQRADCGVVDEQAILAAGRVAFLEDQPDQSDENARLHAEHLGAALYQVAHAQGWGALDDLPGLASLGSVIQVVAPDEQSAPTDDEPTALFGVSGKVLFVEENRYS